MSRFTETLQAHTDETRMFSPSDPDYLVVMCSCGKECGPRRGDHAAHVEEALTAAGIVAVELPEADADETEWGVEVPRSDGKRVVLGPDQRVAMTHFANRNPDHRLMARTVTYGPWLPAAAASTPGEPT